MSKYQYFVSAHSYYVTTDDTLWSFGKNECGQLSLGDQKQRNEPNKVKFFSKKKILNIACGSGHSLIQTSTLEIYSVGKNMFGQLTLGDSNERITPTLITTLKKGKTSIFAGYCHSMFIIGSETFASGCNSNGELGLGNTDVKSLPTKVKLNEQVFDISSGYEFILFLTKNGDVYKSGKVHQEKEVHVPTKVKFPKSEKIEKISAGQYHYAVISKSNKVYGMGDNERGKLDKSFPETVKSPVVLPFFNDKNVVDVKCGRIHSMGLLQNGDSIAWGKLSNAGGSKGKVLDENRGVVLLMKKIVQIECGYFTGFLFDQKGIFYCGGDNSDGNLALPDSVGFSFDNLVKNEAVKNVKCIKINEDLVNLKVELNVSNNDSEEKDVNSEVELNESKNEEKDITKELIDEGEFNFDNVETEEDSDDEEEEKNDEEKLKKELKEIKREKKQLQKKNNELKVELQKSNERIESVKMRFEKHKKKSKFYKREITNLKTQLKEKNSIISSLKKRLSKDTIIQIPKEEITYLYDKEEKIVLGRGGSSKVLKCSYKGKTIALKVVKLDYDHDKIQKSIKKEIEIMQLVKHPLIFP